MSAALSQPAPDPRQSLHLATMAHDGVIWDVYMDFESDVHGAASYRARLRFEPPSGQSGPSSTCTTVIIIEESYEDAVKKARVFDNRQLQALLRSTLPDEHAE